MNNYLTVNDSINNVVVNTPIVGGTFNTTGFVVLLFLLFIAIISIYGYFHFRYMPRGRGELGYVISLGSLMLSIAGVFIMFIVTMATSFGDDSDKTLDSFASQVHKDTGYNVLALGDDVTTNFLGETTNNIGKTYGGVQLVKGKNILTCTMRNVTLSRDSNEVRYLFNCPNK